ncbi:Os01g0117650 [Oryza sativa Japonica Group]|uniref:Os01g0117650 protein n=1 Tax=Oryza sativa subsp. japonica TaxID=39947 RepID=A0A0P0UXL1_ORYSJ|nr:Os01g0117650 [Oryza sativa Japonica Group]
MAYCKTPLQGIAHHHRRMALEEPAVHHCHLQASLSPRSSSVDHMTSSECTTIQQCKASSLVHAYQQCQRSRLFLAESAPCTPVMDNKLDLSLLHLDLHSFFLQPSPIVAFRSYKHRICLI